jgi:MFS family permease
VVAPTGENHGADVAAAGDQRGTGCGTFDAYIAMPRRPPPPWIFVLTAMPYGVAAAFGASVMGFMARSANSDVESIGWYVSLLLIPTFLQFLYAPIVDFWLRRKHWLIGVAVISAGCMYGAMQMRLPDQIGPFLALAFLAQMISGLIGACNGGLMATLIPADKSGRASAFHTIGNVAGGGLVGALVVYMLGHGCDRQLVGMVLVGFMIAPALAALTIDEPRPSSSGSLKEALRTMLREVGSVLGSRVGVTGVLMCLSPVGTAALANYFSGIAEDFVKPGLAHQLATLDPVHAKALLDGRVSELVAWSSGLAGQGLTALGAVAGGLLCDRYYRRAMYLLAGGLTAVCGVLMALGPLTETTFLVGSLAYALIVGFCYSAFTAAALEIIGGEEQAASTRYSLFTAAGNAAITYVGFIDTRFHESHGSSGVIASDAMLNIAGVVVLGAVFWRMGLFRKKAS